MPRPYAEDHHGFGSGGDWPAGAGGVGFCAEFPAEVRDFAK
jgi:hypothetical protein